MQISRQLRDTIGFVLSNIASLIAIANGISEMRKKGDSLTGMVFVGSGIIAAAATLLWWQFGRRTEKATSSGDEESVSIEDIISAARTEPPPTPVAMPYDREIVMAEIEEALDLYDRLWGRKSDGLILEDLRRLEGNYTHLINRYSPSDSTFRHGVAEDKQEEDPFRRMLKLHGTLAALRDAWRRGHF